MYRLIDIRQVGRILILGGLLTVGLAIISQLIVGFEPGATLLSNLIYFVLFGVGWFMFNQLVMSSVFNKLVEETKRTKLTRLEKPLNSPPLGRFGKQPFQRVEIALMIVWAASVVIVQLVLGKYLTLPVGGVAGGWLAGGGFGRLRFFRIISKEQTDQQRLFYFSDSTLGPGTQVAYYTDQETEPATPLEVAASVSSASLPPGIKRRGSGSSNPQSIPGSRKKPPRSGSGPR